MDPITRHQLPARNVQAVSSIGTDDPTQRLTLSRLTGTPPESSSGMRPLPVILGYRLLSEIGRGGMGVVYRAWQENLGRDVALKVVPAGPHRTNEDRLRFRREATTAGRLAHPNIVSIFDVGEHAGNAFLAMEFVDGGTLRQWQDGRPVPPRTAARIVAALADAVQHAHAHGIMHRDLKPANILLAPAMGECHEGVCVRPEKRPPGVWNKFNSGLADDDASLELGFTPKIADFGLAKEMGSVDLTATGYAVGTPNYIAPEQLRGGKTTHLSDVYQLGAILFELLTGRPAFNAASVGEVMRQVGQDESPSPRQFVRGIPRDLEVIVGRCLEKEPIRRFISAAALADDLNRYLAGEPIRVRRLGLVPRSWRWMRRYPATAALVVVSLVAAIGGAALSAFAWDAARQTRAANTALVAEHDRAEENLHIAREATRETLLKLARHQELQQPKFLELRRELLDNAKPIFDSFLTQRADDPDTLREQADLCRELGQLRSDIGDPALALVRYNQSLEMFRQLERIRPTDPAIARALCDVLLLSSRVCRNTGRGDAGDARVDEAAARLRLLLTTTPETSPAYPPTAKLLARAELAFIHSTSDASRVAEADRHFRRALDLTETLARIQPDDETTNNRCRAFRELAQLHARRGEKVQAAADFTRATVIREQLIAANPYDVEQRGDLAEILARHAECVETTAAIALLRRAIILADAISQDAPALTVYLVRLAGYHASLGERLGDEAGLGEITTGIGRLKAIPAEEALRKKLWTRRAAMYDKLGRPADAARDRQSAAE